jgi:hypothetical protein
LKPIEQAGLERATVDPAVNRAAACRRDIPAFMALTTRSCRSTDGAFLMHAGLLRNDVDPRLEPLHRHVSQAAMNWFRNTQDPT